MGIRWYGGDSQAARRFHSEQVALCRAHLCVQALAHHFDCDPGNPAELEEHCGFTAADEFADRYGRHGTVRKWLKNGIRRYPRSATRLKKKTDGKVDLKVLMDAPLLRLIEFEPPQLSWLQVTLESNPEARRWLLDKWERSDALSEFPDRRKVLQLRNHSTLGAFDAMLCLARRGEVTGRQQEHSFPSLCAFDMFPHVLLRYPQWRHRWRVLADCLHRVFWCRIYLDGIMMDLPMSLLERNVEMVLANRWARPQRVSGRLLNAIRDYDLERTLLKWRDPRIGQRAEAKERAAQRELERRLARAEAASSSGKGQELKSGRRRPR